MTSSAVPRAAEFIPAGVNPVARWVSRIENQVLPVARRVGVRKEGGI